MRKGRKGEGRGGRHGEGEEAMRKGGGAGKCGCNFMLNFLLALCNTLSTILYIELGGMRVYQYYHYLVLYLAPVFVLHHQYLACTMHLLHYNCIFLDVNFLTPLITYL